MSFEFFLIFSGICVAIVVPLAFIVLIKRMNSKLPEEANLKPIYQEICGGTFDFVKLTYPLVRLSVYDDFLVISHFSKILLYWKDIKSIAIVSGIQSGFFARGLKIEHNKLGIPKSIFVTVRDEISMQKKLQSYLKK